MLVKIFLAFANAWPYFILNFRGDEIIHLGVISSSTLIVSREFQI
jgi:hypothetical protein